MKMRPEGSAAGIRWAGGAAENAAATGEPGGKSGRRVWLAIRICGILMAAMALLAVQPLLGDEAMAAKRAPDLQTIDHVGTDLTVTWKKVKGCSGYQIQYADNRLFQGKFSRKITKAGTTAQTFSSTAAEDEYFVRIRAYYKKNGKTTYSPWTLSSNVSNDTTLSRKAVRKLLKKFEIRSAAKEKVFQYDTLQGSCYGKGYAYFLLENRSIPVRKARCKIVKVKLKNLSVVKVSKPLKLSHGNDMAYDSKRNRIVVSHSTPVPKKISVVDPGTLKITGSRTVRLPANLPGMSPGRYKYYNGFGAIAYNASHDCYTVLLRGTNFHHIMLLNKDFVPTRFVAIEKGRADQTVQGMDTYGDFFLVGQSYSAGKPNNNILMYDWYGNRLAKLNLGSTYELESIFHTKDGLYAGYYTSYYKDTLLKGKVLKRNNYLYKLTGY